MNALDIIDAEVRAVVRQEGIDPVVERDRVRRIVTDAVSAYDERSLTRALPPLGDAESVTRDVVDGVAGFGPLQRYFDDPEIEEIWINAPSRIFVARRGRSELTPSFSPTTRYARWWNGC